MMQAIPTDHKTFGPWLVEQGCYMAWPVELMRGGVLAFHALEARAHPTWKGDPAERRKHRTNWDAFGRKHASHVEMCEMLGMTLTDYEGGAA